MYKPFKMLILVFFLSNISLIKFVILKTPLLWHTFVGDIDGMKNSPVNGPGTPRDDLPPPVSGTGDMGAYNLPYQDNVSQISL